MHDLTHIYNSDLWEVTDVFPLFSDVVFVTHDHHMFQFSKVEVARPQRHHDITQTDQRRCRVCEQTYNYMTAEYCHGSLVTVLHGNKYKIPI